MVDENRDSHFTRLISWAVLLLFFYKCLGSETGELEELLLCRQCGHEVAKALHFVQIPSKLALRQRNDTILGQKAVLIQLFKNPEGKQFEVVTLKSADVFKDDKAYPEYSWFPGFSWRISVCPRCGFHLGWSFEPHNHVNGKKESDKTFLGLILDNLLHQSYADSLLITPKSYYS